MGVDGRSYATEAQPEGKEGLESTVVSAPLVITRRYFGRKAFGLPEAPRDPLRAKQAEFEMYVIGRCDICSECLFNSGEILRE